METYGWLRIDTGIWGKPGNVCLKKRFNGCLYLFDTAAAVRYYLYPPFVMEDRKQDMFHTEVLMVPRLCISYRRLKREFQLLADHSFSIMHIRGKSLFRAISCTVVTLVSAISR